MIRKWLLPITIVCMLSGFFLAFQLKVQSANNPLTNPLSQKNTNLVTIITDLEEEIKLQEDQIEKIRNELGELESEQVKGSVKELQEELKQNKIAAGITPVSGKGIQIILEDNKEGLRLSPNDDPNKYIIHYENILNIVMELKKARAEAVSINDQRLITTSEIRCVGNVILVNTSRIAPPFKIRAIGNPQLLLNEDMNRELEILKSFNFPLTVSEEEEVIIPGYKGDLQFYHTQSVKEG